MMHGTINIKDNSIIVHAVVCWCDSESGALEEEQRLRMIQRVDLTKVLGSVRWQIT